MGAARRCHQVLRWRRPCGRRGRDRRCWAATARAKSTLNNNISGLTGRLADTIRASTAQDHAGAPSMRIVRGRTGCRCREGPPRVPQPLGCAVRIATRHDHDTQPIEQRRQLAGRQRRGQRQHRLSAGGFVAVLLADQPDHRSIEPRDGQRIVEAFPREIDQRQVTTLLRLAEARQAQTARGAGERGQESYKDIVTRERWRRGSKSRTVQDHLLQGQNAHSLFRRHRSAREPDLAVLHAQPLDLATGKAADGIPRPRDAGHLENARDGLFRTRWRHIGDLVAARCVTATSQPPRYGIGHFGSVPGSRRPQTASPATQPDDHAHWKL